MFKITMKMMRATHGGVVIAQRGLKTYTRYALYSLMDKKGKQSAGSGAKALEGAEQRSSLAHDNVEDFVLSQWSNNPVPYAVYRSLVALYFVYMVFHTAVFGILGVKMFIMLTYWSYYILTVCQVLRAANCWQYIRLRREGIDPKVHLQNSGRIKTQWLLHNLSSDAAPIVSVLFWTVAYDGSGVNFINCNTHGVNAVFVMVDTLITRTPVRLLHLYQCSAIGLIYGLFSAIYWLLGGVNHKNEPFIYKVLDYSKSVRVALIYIFVTAFIMAPMIHCMIFFLYRFRLFIHRFLRVVDRRNHAKIAKDDVQSTQ